MMWNLISLSARFIDRWSWGRVWAVQRGRRGERVRCFKVCVTDICCSCVLLRSQPVCLHVCLSACVLTDSPPPKKVGWAQSGRRESTRCVCVSAGCQRGIDHTCGLFPRVCTGICLLHARMQVRLNSRSPLSGVCVPARAQGRKLLLRQDPHAHHARCLARNCVCMPARVHAAMTAGSSRHTRFARINM